MENETPNENTEQASETPVAEAAGVQPEVQAEDQAEDQVVQPMLLVLAKYERSVKSTLSFLNRRGIPARFISNLNDAIDAFTAKEANMLLLSVNFPHPKIEMIPVLINQSFNLEVIIFAEEQDRKSSQKLQSVKTRHVMMGPVSGPSVMMKIRQIEKDLVGDSGASSSDGANRSMGKSADVDQSINVRSGSSSQAKQEAMASLLNAAKESLVAEEDLKRSGETYVQKGLRTKSNMVTPEQALRAAIDNGLEEPDPLRKTKLIVPLPREMRKQLPLIHKREKYQRKHQAAETHAGLAAEAGLQREALAQEEMKARQEAATIAERIAPIRKKPESDEEDLFLRCILESLETVVGEPDDSLLRVENFKAAMLVAVLSPRVRGAFLIKVGRSKLKAHDMMERIQVAFFSLLRANGIDLRDGEQFAIEIDQKTIASKAFRASNHILVAHTEDVELGLAVVSAADPVPSIVPYEKNMLQVPLADLPAEEPVTFNVFLHLKRNNRFLRYIKTGSKISTKQVASLGRHKITHVLVDGREREAYSRHYAAHSIQPSKRRKTS